MVAIATKLSTVMTYYQIFNTMGVIKRSRNCLTFRRTCVHPTVQCKSCCSILSFLCSVLSAIFSFLSFFFMPFTASGYNFGIFKFVFTLSQHINPQHMNPRHIGNYQILQINKKYFHLSFYKSYSYKRLRKPQQHEEWTIQRYSQHWAQDTEQR